MRKNHIALITLDFFERTLKWSGYPLDKAYARLLELHKMDKMEFRGLVDSAKWNVVNFHYKHNAFYREFFKGNLPDTWDQLPIITKKDLQRDLGSMLTNKYTLKDVYIGNTSGSSGHPFYYVKDKFCHAMSWAIVKHRYKLHGVDYGSRQARFYGIPKTSLSFLKESLKDTAANRVRFPVFDLSDKVLKKFTERFNRVRFEYVYGYTSSIVFFARYLINKKVVLKEICPTLKICIVTSEVCTSEDREIIQKAFGVKVVNEYGASELGVIAFEDADSDWILSDENLYVEILDENNNVLPAGSEGRVVITSLYNLAMPLIRFEIGDVGILSKKEKGIHRQFERLVGRVNDFALLPSGRKSPGLTFYYISRSLLEGGSIIKEFIIKQKAIDTFQFEYVAERDLSVDERNEVMKMMDIYLEPGLKANFVRLDKLDRPVSGKIKHFYNELQKASN